MPSFGSGNLWLGLPLWLDGATTVHFYELLAFALGEDGRRSRRMTVLMLLRLTTTDHSNIIVSGVLAIDPTVIVATLRLVETRDQRVALVGVRGNALVCGLGDDWHIDTGFIVLLSTILQCSSFFLAPRCALITLQRYIIITISC